MARIVTPERLGEEELLARHVTCHRQIWGEGEEYLGYTQHPRPYSGLLYVVSDMQALCRAGGQEWQISQGELLYVPRGLCYRMTFHGGGTAAVDMCTVNFDLQDADGEEVCLADAPCRLPMPDGSAYARAAEELYRAVWDLPCNHLRVAGRFFHLLAVATHALRRQAGGYYPIRHGVDLLRREWDKNEKMGRYAAACGLSESRFYYLFRVWAGVSPVTYRNRLRLLHATSLLRNSSLPVGEVAIRVGFDDPFYFSRLFRRETGMPPHVWRYADTEDNS